MPTIVKPAKIRALADPTEHAFRDPSPQPLLSVRAAAQFLGVSKGWMDKSRLTGSGPSYCRIGRRILYAMPDLLSWLARQKKEHTSQYTASD